MVLDKQQLCATAGYLTLAAPLTPETRQMVGREELARMEPSAVLIKIGRGTDARATSAGQSGIP